MWLKRLFESKSKVKERLFESKSKVKVCANCKHDYIEGDRYCRYCGAPLGKPAFIQEYFSCIYGPPPVPRMHTCEKCGLTWKTDTMIDKQKWCPLCGGSAPYVEYNDDTTVSD